LPAGHAVATPEPVGQYEPAGHTVPTGDAALAAQYVPALHGFDVATVLPVAVQNPAAHAPVHALVVRPVVAPYLPAAHNVGALEPAIQ